ncbi:MAG: peroxidase-related enzyme [Gammaproteobacteria bacterium]|nr:peroxidase-related enzyme [Gammaproteobacteria bacterium]
MISDADATGAVKEMYDLVRTPYGTVDNVMRVHSLRPHTMQGHVTLYRSVLHNPDNTLPFWFLEVVASFTSVLNRCDYSLTHHFANVRRLLADEQRADAIYAALESGRLASEFSGKHLALLRYAGKLTRAVGDMCAEDYQALQAAGCEDGEILEVNQVCAYFNYSNRLLNGLGVTTEDDTIGYYKADE